MSQTEIESAGSTDSALRPHISRERRESIVMDVLRGELSYREIADDRGVSVGSVARYIKQWRESNQCADKGLAVAVERLREQDKSRKMLLHGQALTALESRVANGQITTAELIVLCDKLTKQLIVINNTSSEVEEVTRDEYSDINREIDVLRAAQRRLQADIDKHVVDIEPMASPTDLYDF